MARRPKPTALKLVDGNPGKLPTNKKEPICHVAPKAPPWLPAKAKSEWRRYAPEMERMGLLTKVDVPVFAGFCSAVAEFRWCEEHLRKNGRLIETPNGHIQTSPVVSQRKQAMEMIRKFGAEFGLTPASRSKIIVSDDKLPTIGNVFGPAVKPDG